MVTFVLLAWGEMPVFVDVSLDGTLLFVTIRKGVVVGDNLRLDSRLVCFGNLRPEAYSKLKYEIKIRNLNLE